MKVPKEYDIVPIENVVTSPGGIMHKIGPHFARKYAVH